MKFIIDAQLPKRLCKLLSGNEVDCVHTLDLPDRNKTKDNQILQLSVLEKRIVVTKDSDFLRSFLLKRMPPKLFLISTVNMQNDELLKLFEKHFSVIKELFEKKDFIELTKDEIIVHE